MIKFVVQISIELFFVVFLQRRSQDFQLNKAMTMKTESDPQISLKIVPAKHMCCSNKFHFIIMDL